MWEKALAFSQQAGEKAQNLYAPREAHEWFTRALDAAQRVTLPPPTHLFLARGQAYATLGEFERARVDYEQALQAAKLAEDRASEWQCSINLGFLWVSKDYEKAGEYFHQALTLARTLPDASILAHSLNRLGNWYMNVEQTFEAIQHHLEALTIFENQQDTHGLAETLDMLGISIIRAGVLPRLAGVLLVVGPPMWILFAEPPAPFFGYLISGFLISVAWIWLGYSIWAGSHEMAMETETEIAGSTAGL